MKIEQFEDQGLSHFSYAILSEETREIVLVDPARNPQQYYDFAKANEARIVAVIETHPHADFVSSHAEIARATGAAVRVSKLLGAGYPHQAFDEGDTLTIGKLTFRALNTPGHSPDSISIVLASEGQDVAVFTGDLSAGTPIAWSFLLGFLAFALGGIVLGTYLARFIPGAKLKPAFGWFTLAMGTFILVRELAFH